MSKIVKDKLSKKDKIKKVIFIIIHVICYSCTFLFILACIFGGINSCNQKTSGVSAESMSFNTRYSYRFKYLTDSEITMDQNTHGDLLTAFGLPVSSDDYEDGQTFDYSFNLSESYTSAPYYEKLVSINYRFKAYSYYGTKLVRFDRAFFIDYEDDEILIIEITDSSPSTYTYDTYGDANFLSNYEFWSLTGTQVLWFDYTALDSFIFNLGFNYNNFLNVSIKSPYGISVSNGIDQGTLFKVVHINTGYFITNDEIFNEIQVWYQKTDGAYFLTHDSQGGSEKILSAPSDNWFYWNIAYYNSHTNVLKIVNNRDQSAFSTGSGDSYYYLNSATWVTDNYRYINFLNPINNDTKTHLLSFNSNNQSYYGGNIYSGTDVFTLLSNAFTALLPFLSINILPSISIGVLLFLPGIVAIIVIIFNILRK